MKRQYTAYLMELVLMIDLYVFIYSNFFSSFYEYGEVKNIVRLVTENASLIIVFLLASTVLIILKVKPSRTKRKIENVVLSISTSVWIIMILLLNVLDLNLDEQDILFAFFVGFTTLTIYLGVKKFGISFL